MKKFANNLKIQAENNPLVAILIAATAVTAAAKLIEASTERERSKTWAKEVNRRSMKF
jgi:hypothetical protein